MTRKICFLLAFILPGFVNSLGAQKLECKSYTFHVGAVVTMTSQLSLEQLQTRFPEVDYLKNDFSSYHYDSSIYHYGIIPIQLEFEMAFAKTDSTKRFFKKSEYRFKAGFYRQELTYENRVSEQFQPINGLNYGIISRDYYSFWWISNHVYAGADWVFNSRYFGKKKRSRIYGGSGITLGIASGSLTSYHLTGTYEGREVASDYSYAEYEYFFPAIEQNENTRMNKVPSFGTVSLEFPGGYEIALGAKRRFLLGLRMRPGYMWMLNPDEQAISGVTVGVAYSFRFLINRP